MKRKWLFCIIAVLLLAGCYNSTGIEAIEHYETEERTEDKTCNVAQQVAIAKNLIVGKCQTEGKFFLDNYYCSVTDLNSNGRLEIIIAYCGGSGRYTYFSIYEMDEKCENAVEIYTFNGENMNERAPDIIKTKWEGIYDEEQGFYHYYISDLLKDGIVISHDDLMELSFDDVYECKSVYCVENQYDSDGELVTTYYDSERNFINKSEYESGISELNRNFNITYYIKWLSVNELGTGGIDGKEQLRELYQSGRLVYDNK